MKKQLPHSSPTLSSAESSTPQEPELIVPPGATCFVCGGTDESELHAESPIYPDVYVHSSCCDTETAVSWCRAREQEDPRYKRYRISHSIEVEVICGTCQTRHWLHSRSVGMAAGNWPTHCTQCYRLGKTFSEFDPQTREYVGGRLDQLEWQFYFEGLTPEIEAAMQAFAAQYDKHTNPQPCLCGGQFSIAAKPRCKHCSQVLYDTYFNFAVPPRACDFAYQAFPSLPGRPQSSASEETSDINTPDIYGQTALSQASLLRDQSVVQELLGSGALVDHQDKRGWTALMWAAALGHLEVVRTLLTHGATAFS